MLDDYCRALSGRQVRVAPTSELVDKKLGWTRVELPTCDGTAVFLPHQLVLPPDPAPPRLEPFDWYKVMATHQVMLIGHGSYTFEYARAFPGQPPRAHAAPHHALSQYAQFFSRFSVPRLARDLFALAEGARIDARVLQLYPGLEDSYRGAQTLSLRQRTVRSQMTPQEAFVEWLLHTSLGATAARPPKALAETSAQQALQVLRDLRAPDRQVEDSARAADALYRLALFREPPERMGEYHATDHVLYRGAFKPELGQLLSDALDQHDVQPPETPSGLTRRTQLESLTKESSEVEPAEGKIPEEIQQRDQAANLDDELSQRAPPATTSDGQDGAADDDEALEAEEANSFTYDEWDAGRGAYRKQHCLLREQRPPQTDNDFYQATLHRHANLAEHIRRQFEAIALELRQTQTRFVDGEELDLDAAIEAVIDLRSGRSPADKLQLRRSKRERDVAAAFLLDMSASTGDPVDPGADRHAPGVRRIIDVQREAVVVLAEALQTLGDRYGIYGFSGFGRKHVEFYVIKELAQALDAGVKSAIGCLDPQSATRMGPAIRHATTKLLGQSARTRLLFLISDGRPQDKGYSNHGAAQLYAVEDTRDALLAAQRRGITPCCLAIDKGGHDYLGTMMQDMRYEVIWDVDCLPERLSELYRSITT